jgi:hypothetical protein
MKLSLFEHTKIDFELSVHVRPGPNAHVTVTVDTDSTRPITQIYDLAPTIDWQLDATVDHSHKIIVTLPIFNFNLINIACNHNDILILGYQPQQPGLWRFASVPEWQSGQLYDAPDDFDGHPRALPIYHGDRVSFYCRAIGNIKKFQ